MTRTFPRCLKFESNSQAIAKALKKPPGHVLGMEIIDWDIRRGRPVAATNWVAIHLVRGDFTEKPQIARSTSRLNVELRLDIATSRRTNKERDQLQKREPFTLSV